MTVTAAVGERIVRIFAGIAPIAGGHLAIGSTIAIIVNIAIIVAAVGLMPVVAEASDVCVLS